MNSDCSKLEKLLGQTTPASPPEAMRARILEAARGAQPRPLWPFIESLAACLLVGMNLALAVGLVAPASPRPRRAAAPQEVCAYLKSLDIDPQLAGVARLGLPDNSATPTAPTLNVRSLAGELQ